VQEKVEPLTSELPDGSVVAGASVTWIRNHPKPVVPVARERRRPLQRRQVQEELDAKRAEILRARFVLSLILLEELDRLHLLNRSPPNGASHDPPLHQLVDTAKLIRAALKENFQA